MVSMHGVAWAGTAEDKAELSGISVVVVAVVVVVDVAAVDAVGVVVAGAVIVAVVVVIAVAISVVALVDTAVDSFATAAAAALCTCSYPRVATSPVLSLVSPPLPSTLSRRPRSFAQRRRVDALCSRTCIKQHIGHKNISIHCTKQLSKCPANNSRFLST